MGQLRRIRLSARLEKFGLHPLDLLDLRIGMRHRINAGTVPMVSNRMIATAIEFFLFLMASSFPRSTAVPSTSYDGR